MTWIASFEDGLPGQAEPGLPAFPAPSVASGTRGRRALVFAF